MKRTLPLTLGALMFVIGTLWTFQGLGYVEGSPMTGVAIWAIIGPLVAGLGVGFFLAGLKRSRDGS
jgi:membrane associated rhomboid family serine protease